METTPAQQHSQRMRVLLPLRAFLTMPACPPGWKDLDLYLVRDEQVVFYVGQSACAFHRLWEHLKGGPHGHSILGRFLLCNWPASGRFIVELHGARGPRFAALAQYDADFQDDSARLNAAERLLIEEFQPCFNVALNGSPRPLPAQYLPPNAPIRHLKNFRRMLREAAYAERMHPADIEW